MTLRRSGGTSTDEYARRRHEMVERQLRRRGIRDERVLRAMEQVPRERFVPEAERSKAYRDGALRIGEGQTISQPWIVASMTALLGLEPDGRALEVGTGSGYAAAVLSLCCREVVTIERHGSLAEHARAVLGELGYQNVDVRVGDGARGAPDRAPFDGISVTATAEGGPPPALIEQLAPDGALVCPVHTDAGERLTRFRRDGSAEPVVPVRFVPLIEDPGDGA
ncbi:MAG TPA: protein-L-isoaspartate(D-aspartate) O-methyltransferase [Thermoleophilaceae bacterium]|nr:protein-L-isoaspartate(D-aspartate) O-methyltransferase [Thermoleophilaceae bacterium]